MADDQQPPQGPPPTDEELRAQLEEQIRNVRVEDLVLESAAQIINLTYRRIAKEDERDLEQARLGVDAVTALTELLSGEPANQLRQALSDVRLAYAEAARGGGDTPEGAAQPAPQQAPPAQKPPAPGGGGSGPPSKLWTPGRGS